MTSNRLIAIIKKKKSQTYANETQLEKAFCIHTRVKQNPSDIRNCVGNQIRLWEMINK